MAQKPSELDYHIEYKLPDPVYRAGFLPAYIEVPKPKGDHDPVADLNASGILALITPQNGQPARVRSVTVHLRGRPGVVRGKRLVDVASLLSFLDSLPNDGERRVNP
jgi:hypothetical protein